MASRINPRPKFDDSKWKARVMEVSGRDLRLRPGQARRIWNNALLMVADVLIVIGYVSVIALGILVAVA
jgi:hypothetical protein